ncbi:MAG: cytidine deaminase [Firmicutes bacterium]|nr:cytidine deaminase [Bacillota bacterium]
MREKLEKLLQNSYSPYSKFQVAAIVVLNDGTEIRGVNVENASYGATICAERSAIVSAVSKGYQKGDFKKLYVMVNSDKISTCCFICRQVIAEFFSEDAEIVCMSQKEEKTFLVRDLCPNPFNEDDLK